MVLCCGRINNTLFYNLISSGSNSWSTKGKIYSDFFLYDVRSKHLHITLGRPQLNSFSQAIEMCSVIPFTISELHLCHLMFHFLYFWIIDKKIYINIHCSCSQIMPMHIIMENKKILVNHLNSLKRFFSRSLFQIGYPFVESF